MHAHGADAAHGADGARDLALQRAGLVDLLLELGGGEAIGSVEDLVADGAAGGQALVGQRQPCLGDLSAGTMIWLPLPAMRYGMWRRAS